MLTATGHLGWARNAAVWLALLAPVLGGCGDETSASRVENCVEFNKPQNHLGYGSDPSDALRREVEQELRKACAEREKAGDLKGGGSGVDVYLNCQQQESETPSCKAADPSPSR